MSMYEILEETQKEQEVSGGIDADYILLLSAGPNLFGKKTYDLNLLGASMQNWVARACAKKPAIAAEPDEEPPHILLVSQGFLCTPV